MLPEVLIPFQPVIQPGKPLLGVGGVAGDKVKLGVFQGNEPPLGVQFLHTQAVLHRKGRFFGKNGRTRVALFLGVVPVLVVARQGKVNLPFL